MVVYSILRQTHEYLWAVCIAVIIVIVLIVTKRIDYSCSDSLSCNQKLMIVLHNYGDDDDDDDDDDIPLYPPLNPTKIPLSPIQPPSHGDDEWIS